MGKATFFSRYLNSLTINALVACCGWWFFDFATRFTILPKTKSGISSENMPRLSFLVSPIRCLNAVIGQLIMAICNRVVSCISTVVFSVLSRRVQTHATDQCRYFPQDFRTINLASYDKGSRGNGWEDGYAPAWFERRLTIDSKLSTSSTSTRIISMIFFSRHHQGSFILISMRGRLFQHFPEFSSNRVKSL